MSSQSTSFVMSVQSFKVLIEALTSVEHAKEVREMTPHTYGLDFSPTHNHEKHESFDERVKQMRWRSSQSTPYVISVDDFEDLIAVLISEEHAKEVREMTPHTYGIGFSPTHNHEKHESFDERVKQMRWRQMSDAMAQAEAEDSEFYYTDDEDCFCFGDEDYVDYYSRSCGP